MKDQIQQGDLITINETAPDYWRGKTVKVREVRGWGIIAEEIEQPLTILGRFEYEQIDKKTV